MKIWITSALAACGLVAAASCAYADGITDFYSIQRGFGYDAAPLPAGPAAFPLWTHNAGQGVDPAVETLPGAEPQAPTPVRHVRHHRNSTSAL